MNKIVTKQKFLPFNLIADQALSSVNVSPLVFTIFLKQKEKRFFFHSFSVRDTQTKTFVFVSLSSHLFDSETKTKCFVSLSFL